MVEETNFEGEIVFKCEKCGWLYENIGKAKGCEEWCRNHNSCNLKFVKYALKIK